MFKVNHATLFGPGRLCFPADGRLKQANKDLLRGLHDAEQRIAQLEVELGRQSSPFQAWKGDAGRDPGADL